MGKGSQKRGACRRRLTAAEVYKRYIIIMWIPSADGICVFIRDAGLRSFRAAFLHLCALCLFAQFFTLAKVRILVSFFHEICRHGIDSFITK